MTVYVVQRQMRYDHDKKTLVPRFADVEKATSFGDIEYVLSPNDHPYNPTMILGKIHDKLKDFCDEDHLLLIGSPGLIAMITAIAAHYNEGRVKFLQWNGRHLSYDLIEARLF